MLFVYRAIYWLGVIIIEFLLLKIIVLIFVYIAVIYDIKTYKIPNKLNLAGCFTGILYSMICGGVRGVFNSLIWIFIPVVLMFILYCFSVIGAGDIKLFSVIGSFVFQEVLKVIILAFLLAAAFGLVVVGKKIYLKIKDKKTAYAFGRLHFSIPIALGVTVILI